ncbi:hypothetical protein DC522_30540 [Microvirga sp. KLBC 81]|uniref:PAS domain S-box protein n=1 Tax=Microvirga sp. KLBC 81 TaxID=1862707 RepID=UPI000D519C43|nr:PAS domain S-box protein [Microvirga sp. KLBC 81]PVE20746.1 hypothetical protein DC522_30540 [Microvirga sp. KLBC 81]
MSTADAPNGPAPGVDDVLIPAELARRPCRPPDYEAENRALATLAEEMATNPRSVLQTCAALSMELCHADSAAISLLEPGVERRVFRWHAIVGELTGQLGGGVPLEAGPCGTVSERNGVLLLNVAERLFPDLGHVEPRVYENLLAPWHSNGKLVGTLWAVKHTPEGRFDAEDARVLQSLARFAAASHRVVAALDEARNGRAELERRVEERTRPLSEAYESVRASETRIRTALEIETVGVIYLDQEGQIIDANDAFLAMGGYSREDLEAGCLTWQGLTPPEWMEASEQAITELKATGRTTPYEKEYIRKDGSRWWALFAAKRLPDGTIFEFVLDLTARKQAEETLASELKAMTRLHELSRQLVRSADLQVMLEQILDATIELHGADFGNIQLYDTATQTLRIAVQRGFQQSFLDHFAEVDANEGSACGMALARRERVVIEDVEQEPAYASSLEVAREAGYRAVQSTPLFTPTGQPLGMLSTHFRRPHRLSERNLRLTDVYARLASDAIAAQLLTQSLRESEERFRAVAEQAEAGIVMVNAEGQVIFANDRFGEIVGRTRDDLVGRTVRELTHPEDWGLNEPLLQRMLTQGEPYTIEKRHVRPDGSSVWVRNAVSPLRDATGRIGGGFAICIDLTERKQAEDALCASEERFQYVARATRDIIWDIDLVADRVWWSDAMLRQLGYAPQDIGPDTAWCFAHMHPDDRERVVRGMREAAAGTGDTWSDEFRYQCADGSYAYIADRGFILRDAQGRAVRMIGAMQDISVRKQAEEALRASEERFRQFGEASTDVLWIRNANTLQWEYLSPAFEAVYGGNRESALAGDNMRNWTERIIPEDRGHVLDSINRVRAGERVTFEFRIIRPDGQMRWMRDTNFPLLDETGRVQRIGGIGQDITERKEAEEALRQSESRARLLLGELQHRVRNTLAVIRSIVRRTAQTSKSVEDYAMHLDGRINAFARVQTAVARNPAAGLDLTDLIVDELLTYAAHQGEQVQITGPSVRLNPKAAETFGLAVHELATNAVKHGALTVPQGRVRVSWQIHDGSDLPWLVFEWKESGAPDQAAKRKRRGFGTDLLERTLAYELKAKTVQTFEPDGLRCTIRLPMTDRFVMGNAANVLQQD